MCLYQQQKAKRIKIEKTPDIALLYSLGVRTGITVSVITKQPFGGPIIIKVANRHVALAKGIASQIDVREVV